MGSAGAAQESSSTPSAEGSGVSGWYLWRSDAGKPYATRSPAVLTSAQQRLNCELTIGGENDADFYAKLEAQRELDRQAGVSDGTEA